MTIHEEVVKKKLERLGFQVYKRGGPDFICSRNGQVAFIEAKSRGDRLSADQVNVHAALRKAGVEVHVIRDEEDPVVFEKNGESAHRSNDPILTIQTPGLLSKQDVARILKVGIRTVSDYMRHGILGYVKLQKTVRFIPTDVLSFIEKHRISEK
jgi:predicted type IV restriction endonuclease